MELFASRGLAETVRSAADDTVVPVRIVRAERPGATTLRPLAIVAPQSDVVVSLSSRALELARGRDGAIEHEPSRHRPPPPRGQRLDVLA